MQICETAAGIARKAGYRNAGTVEFIFGTQGDQAEYYFLEMNTRLQVEHPVTEQIVGKDLVLEQLKVAAGEKLAFTQDDIEDKGHAIEFRIYAEDPGRGYTPTTGPILALRHPTGPAVRVDSGIVEGGEVTAAFDPMLAKLIVTGKNRKDAIAKADKALAEYVLLGCKTNVSFLRRLLNHPSFAAGEIHTGFLDAHPEIAADPEMPQELLDKVLAAASLVTRQVKDGADAVPSMHAAMGHWRN
jgi:propionyl-CoA carboxylase alpha chain/3-methylcrotonyl-CoA carboxylase alpha subunit/acetyl-CoA/propionyl-CoA carboxylase biotin carboxyl carrier protein